MTGNPKVLVIGAGSIGVNAAYFLADCGASVTLLDKGDTCEGSSWGNAGLIVPSHSIPFATPGVGWRAFRWMFDPTSPFYIRPRVDLKLWSWLWKFKAACTVEHRYNGSRVLRDLSNRSMELYTAFQNMDGFDFSFENNGMMILYSSDSGRRHGLEEAKLLRGLGLSVKDLDKSEVLEQLGQETTAIAGTYFPGDAHLLPADFVKGLARKAKSKGVEIKTHTEVHGFSVRGKKIVGVLTDNGVMEADEIVLAAGSWSTGVAEKLDLHLPIQPAKGYSVSYERPNTAPTLPLILAEPKSSVTPMGNILRIGGTLELVGMDLSHNKRRIAAIVRAAKQFLPTINFDGLPVNKVWAGLRPVTPDGLPLLGRCKSFENLTLATGHATIGISTGPASGMLVAQTVLRERTFMDIRMFDPDRYIDR